MASGDVSICLTADLTATFFHLRALRSVEKPHIRWCFIL